MFESCSKSKVSEVTFRLQAVVIELENDMSSCLNVVVDLNVDTSVMPNVGCEYWHAISCGFCCALIYDVDIDPILNARHF